MSRNLKRTARDDLENKPKKAKQNIGSDSDSELSDLDNNYLDRNQNDGDSNSKEQPTNGDLPALKQEPSIKSKEPSPVKQPKKAPSKTPKKSQTPKTPMSQTPASPSKLKSENDATDTPKQEPDEEDDYKWWVQQDTLGDGTQRWTTLEHNGVFFPPEYVPLPKEVRMKYDGKNVELSLEAEEVAGFYAAVLGSDHAADQVFNKNFFNDFLDILRKHPPLDGTKIQEFEKCDFQPIKDYLDQEKEKKKAMTRDEKKAAKEQREEIEKPFTHCLLDGRKEKVGNFRIEPPSLFRGRGAHPRKGKLKLRIKPEQITINIGEGAKVPEAPSGRKWGSVQHDNTVTWLAMWKENINGNYKYVYLAPGSTLKGQSDMSKFEKARELKQHIGRIREDYEADLNNKVMYDRQRATAVYLVDRLALRAGNEKGEDEADTVGCCSLRCEHVMLRPPNLVTFDFLGKDSVRFYQEDIEVSPQVFKNLRIFKKEPKGPQDPIFDRIQTTVLNKYFGKFMKGLSAKVFRTYNASITFQEELQNTPKEGTVAEKLLAFNRANRNVAILCNHQKNVSKTHGAAMDKMGDRLKAIKYQRRKIRQMLEQVVEDKKVWKENPKFKEEESDLDDEWMDAHEDNEREKDKERQRKKFERDNEKLRSEDQKEMKPQELDDRLNDVDEKWKTIQNERRSGKPDVGKKSESNLLTSMQKIEDRLEAFRVNASNKDEIKDVSLASSPNPSDQLWRRFVVKPAKYAAFAGGSIVFGISAFITIIFAHDAMTYKGSNVDKVHVNPLSLAPQTGGKKNLPITNVFMDDEEDPEAQSISKKPHLVIIGNGWGGIGVLKELEHGDYKVTVISPANHTLFTPLLPSAAVGTVEIRSLVEPLRKLVARLRGHYISGAAADIDMGNRLIEVHSKRPDGSVDQFYVPYDKVVIAVGANTASHGVPGLEHCYQLKTVGDVLRIRRTIMQNLEAAALPTTSQEERKRLLSFVICGGGPTGIEMAAEIFDVLNEEVGKYFPKLLRKEISVHVIQSRDHILNTYSEKISEYAEKKFAKDEIDVILNARVSRVEKDRMMYTLKTDKGEKVEHEIPSGFILWSTGLGMNPFAKRVCEQLPNQFHSKAIIVDSHMRVKGAPQGTVYAIGDNATVDNNLLDALLDLVDDCDKDQDGKIDFEEFEIMSQKLRHRFPLAKAHLQKIRKIFQQYDKDQDNVLDLNELASLFSEISSKIVSLPATAQVASQEGKYLGKKLSKLAAARDRLSGTDMVNEAGDVDDEVVAVPFSYRHLGSLAYIGNSAVFDFGSPELSFAGGLISLYLWRSIYWSEQVSNRTRALVMIDWIKRGIWGRDLSKF
ncbi:putative DNA topoisomerase [Wallemia mellicola]|uniref:DNA topoisomerase I n=1 Tax=Wallemia mellicola TaxID=1708541 RepID=A0AB38MW12_9BASI|nr:putative DNA topoisomerase [Wallemia mellicola]